MFTVSAINAVSAVSFPRASMEDALVKASEVMQGGMLNVKITDPEGVTYNENEISEIIKRVRDAHRP